MRSFISCTSTAWALLSALAYPVVYSQDSETTAIGCFDEYNLTCKLSLDQGDPNVDVVTACANLEEAIEARSDVPVFLVSSPSLGTAMHQQALRDLNATDPLCIEAQNVYHRCWWCQTLQQQYEEEQQQQRDNSNSTEVSPAPGNEVPQPAGCFDVRSITCNVPLDQGDSTIHVETACQAIEDKIKEQSGKEITMIASAEDTTWHQQALSDLTVDDTLCHATQTTYHKCWFCSDQHEDQEEVPPAPCFENRDLTCNVPLSHGNTDFEINLACLAMEQAIERNAGKKISLVTTSDATEWHQQALTHLTDDDYLCYGAHQAYHKVSVVLHFALIWLRVGLLTFERWFAI